MQPPPPPITPYEEGLTQSYQLLNMARMQNYLMHHNTVYCVDRCLDTEELYTLLRTTQAPIRYRLQKDLEEKQCAQHCNSKWEFAFTDILNNANEHAVQEVQANAMKKMMEAMQQQQRGP